MNIQDIPVYSGPDSVKPGSKGRKVDLTNWSPEFDHKEFFMEWPAQYRRKYAPLKSHRDGHLLSDDEIDLLLRSINKGFNANDFSDVNQFLDYLTYRQQLPEKTYGMYESDISVCRFFTSERGEKQENILADIRKLNEEQNMGNIKIPGTDVEIINYSPCPKCGHIHSFADVFNYYQHPTPDPVFKNAQEQYAMDTRVQCKECNDYFLPALIVSDGSPKVEHQMICRMQTVREVGVFMKSQYKLDVLVYKKENILVQPETQKRAWRNDVDAKLLKSRQGLFTNFLQYTPAPLMLNFLGRKNLELQEPLYGVWKKPEEVQYIDM